MTPWTARTYWCIACIACIAAMLCAAFGVWLPLSFGITTLGEPFADLREFVQKSVFCAAVLTVLSIPLAGVFLLIEAVVINPSPGRPVLSARLAIRLCRWVALPVLLIGVHLACWAMHVVVSPAHVDWLRLAPTPEDFVRVWAVFHTAGLSLALTLWVLLGRIEKRLLRAAADEPVCARCGYALVGLAAPMCPECGQPAVRR